ncbi:MAG: GatB/YqeY domain-containing protein [Saprospiraceae bacterium]|nr:GatB/YqeY domain-containing protein [Saprospiraceae bacterium]MBK6564623.1 GatB/YqeY domain-containing protein [Saprospiraceae bacterium]MBK6782808.1 GatB/YqeY domain-containing protein [Saprospiraceae bacterium]MBK7523264.1 GatB/YqeY domain-containing protein [Saprospiraceae bacterium]MBK8079357.1 GatB/YqeY domain-containing protein [Saprospiraceae bacterium]
MNLETKINNDLKEAMKNKDQAALRGIRAIKAAILLFKTDGSGQDLNEEKEIKLLQKLMKQRQDSLDIYVKQNRDDLAIVEREEMEIIQRYLPEQMNEEELKKVIQNIISETGASGIKDMGKVMGLASQKLSGKADGKTIAALVKDSLS